MKPAEQISNNEEIVSLAITKTILTVGKLLLDKQAILLSTIHNLYSECVMEIAVFKGIERPEDVTSRWILSKLIAELQHHIAYKCKVRKYGTLTYRIPSHHTILFLSFFKPSSFTFANIIPTLFIFSFLLYFCSCWPGLFHT